MRTCTYCDENRLPCLRNEKGVIVCYNCSTTYSKQTKVGKCFLCKLWGLIQEDMPIEYHHVLGRKNHCITVSLCLNCHRNICANPYGLDSWALYVLALDILEREPDTIRFEWVNNDYKQGEDIVMVGGKRRQGMVSIGAFNNHGKEDKDNDL